MNVDRFITLSGRLCRLCHLLGEEAYWTWIRSREALSESCMRSRERGCFIMEMACLERTAERIREGAAERIAKSLEGLSPWKLEHGEVGCTKGRLRRKCKFGKAVGADFCSLVLAKKSWTAIGIGCNMFCAKFATAWSSLTERQLIQVRNRLLMV